MSQSLEYQRTIHAPAAEAYRAFTSATSLRNWLCDVALADARPGGRLYLWWNAGYYMAGEYTALEQDRLVVFTWMGRDEPARTQVEVRLEGQSQATRVTLNHRGMGEGEAWGRAQAQFGRGWIAGLENLQSLLERGEDLRYTRRPMLGITLEDFNPQIAQKLGVPVVEGIRLTAAVPGFAAAKAGLQGNDVIVELSGKPTPDFPALVAALQGKRAGDVVEVAFYRGKVRHVAPITLSSRLLPEIPATPAGLAAALRQINARLLDELDSLLSGVPEEAANLRPTSGEWSALEVVAHLVLAERETHSWVADLVNDDERFSDRSTDGTTVSARLSALLAVNSTVEQMLGAMRDSLRETEGIIAALPDEVVAHRDSYWRIGHNLLQADQHWSEHVNQIQGALRRSP
jgi:uncharacterized protein YndB with AHSA1/START domain